MSVVGELLHHAGFHHAGPFEAFVFFAVEIRFILQAGTMKPRRGRQADPAAKRCRATRSPKRGELRLIYVRLVGTSSPRRPVGLMRGWLCAGHFRMLILRRIVGADGGSWNCRRFGVLWEST